MPKRYITMMTLKADSAPMNEYTRRKPKPDVIMWPHLLKMQSAINPSNAAMSIFTACTKNADIVHLLDC